MTVLRLCAKYGYADHDITVKIFMRREEKIAPEAITRYFCEEYGMSWEKVFSRTRKEPIRIVRQMIQYCMVKLTGLSFIEMGRLTCRDHSTITNSHKVIQNYMDTDKDFNDDMQRHMANLME